MIELLRTDNPVLISAVMAALAEDGIDAVEFDGIADIFGATFPRPASWSSKKTSPAPAASRWISARNSWNRRARNAPS